MTHFFEDFILNQDLSQIKADKFYHDFFVGNPIEITSNSNKAAGVHYNESSGILVINSYEYNVPLESLIHEMGHIAEIENPERLRKLAYGFGTSYKVMPAFEREMRVFAYEASLYKYLRIAFPTDILMDNMNVVIAGSDLYGSPFRNNSRAIDPAIRKTFREYKKIYTIDKFKVEWRLKMEYLKELYNQ